MRHAERGREVRAWGMQHCLFTIRLLIINLEGRFAYWEQILLLLKQEGNSKPLHKIKYTHTLSCWLFFTEPNPSSCLYTERLWWLCQRADLFVSFPSTSPHLWTRMSRPQVASVLSYSWHVFMRLLAEIVFLTVAVDIEVVMARAGGHLWLLQMFSNAPQPGRDNSSWQTFCYPKHQVNNPLCYKICNDPERHKASQDMVWLIVTGQRYTNRDQLLFTLPSSLLTIS